MKIQNSLKNHGKIAMFLILFVAVNQPSLAMDPAPEEQNLINRTHSSDRSCRAYFLACCQKPILYPAIAIVTTAAFGAGFIYFFHDYDPNVLKEFLAHTFFNDSSLGMFPGGASACFDSCTHYPIDFIPHANFGNDPYKGPGYFTWGHDGSYDEGVFVKGNLSDMVGYIMDSCGCDNFEHWYNYAKTILEGAQFDPAIAHCFANDDNQTMCCGSGWGLNTWPSGGWFPGAPESNLSMRMINGSGVCAQAQEYQSWTTKLGIYSVLGSLVPTASAAFAWFYQRKPPSSSQQ